MPNPVDVFSCVSRISRTVRKSLNNIVALLSGTMTGLFSPLCVDNFRFGFFFGPLNIHPRHGFASRFDLVFFFFSQKSNQIEKPFSKGYGKTHKNYLEKVKKIKI